MVNNLFVIIRLNHDTYRPKPLYQFDILLFSLFLIGRLPGQDHSLGRRQAPPLRIYYSFLAILPFEYIIIYSINLFGGH